MKVKVKQQGLFMICPDVAVVVLCSKEIVWPYIAKGERRQPRALMVFLVATCDFFNGMELLE